MEKMLSNWEHYEVAIYSQPSVTFTPEGKVFVYPELAKELEKSGNEGLTELLLSMARQGAPIERRRLQEGGKQHVGNRALRAGGGSGTLSPHPALARGQGRYRQTAASPANRTAPLRPPGPTD
jgi:hypothetical protein